MSTNLETKVNNQDNLYCSLTDKDGYLMICALYNTNTIPTNANYGRGCEVTLKNTGDVYLNTGPSGGTPVFTKLNGGGGSGAVDSVFGRTGAVVAEQGDYTKSDVGLGNVDNTSDADKPISDDTQAALDLKFDADAELPVDQGGTGVNVVAEGDIIYGTGVNTTAVLPIGDDTYVLTSDGNVPYWAPASGGSGNNIFSANLTQSADRTHDQNSFAQVINEAGDWTFNTTNALLKLIPSEGRIDMENTTDSTIGNYRPESLLLSESAVSSAYLGKSASVAFPWFNMTRAGENDFGAYSGQGTPESVLVTDIGSMYMDTLSGEIYTKVADSGFDTGWAKLRPEFQTDGVANTNQAVLNLEAGTNITLTDDGLGTVTIDASGGGGGGGGTAIVLANQASASLTDSTFITIGSWTTVELNVGSCFNDTTGVFTAPSTANYQISVFGSINSFATTQESRLIMSFVKNGSDQVAAMQDIVLTGLTGDFPYSLLPLSATFALTAGDTIEWRVRQSSGADQALLSSASSSRFQVIQLG